AGGNDGAIFKTRLVSIEENACGTNSGQARMEILELDHSTERVVAYVEGRCGSPGTMDVSGTAGVQGVVFDQATGQLLVGLYSVCFDPSSTGNCTYNQSPDDARWLMALTGFATEFEILQSYIPTSN